MTGHEEQERQDAREALMRAAADVGRIRPPGSKPELREWAERLDEAALDLGRFQVESVPVNPMPARTLEQLRALTVSSVELLEFQRDAAGAANAERRRDRRVAFWVLACSAVAAVTGIVAVVVALAGTR